MAKIHYEADGAVSAERFIAALTDFGPRRPELWPGLDAKFYELHELGDTWADVTEGTDIFGGVWAREHYDWSEPGVVRLTLKEAVDFCPGRSRSIASRLVRTAAAMSRWTSSGSRGASADGSSASSSRSPAAAGSRRSCARRSNAWRASRPDAAPPALGRGHLGRGVSRLGLGLVGSLGRVGRDIRRDIGCGDDLARDGLDVGFDVGVGVDVEPVAAAGLVDPGADATDRPPGTLPDGRLGRDRRHGDAGHDDDAGGDRPARSDERARALADPHEGPGAGDGRTEVDGSPVDGAPVEPTGRLRARTAGARRSGGRRPGVASGQRIDDLLAVDLGKVGVPASGPP